MRKKTWIIGALLIAPAMMLVVALALIQSPTPGPTYANFNRLEKGMSQEQVERLLGKPNAVHLELGFEFMLVQAQLPHDTAIVHLCWRSGDGDHLMVGLDQDGKATFAAWNGITDERGSFEKLRDRMPWIRKSRSPGKINLNTVTR